MELSNENEKNLEDAQDIILNESSEVPEIKASDELERSFSQEAAAAPEVFVEPEFHIGFISGNDIHNMGYDNFNAMCFNFALLCFGFAFLKWAAAILEKVVRRLGRDGERS